ncbi:MAG: fibronectin type III domain-containing protein [Candidatus Moraniibacteriota bacterium]
MAVSDISVSQSTQDATLGKVIVGYTYSIQSDISAATNIGLEFWNGTSWIGAATVTGDSGANVSSGAKQIIWNAKQDYSQQYSTTAKVRLVATYGSTSQVLTAADYLLDTKNPVLPAVPVIIDHSVSANQVSIQTPTDDSTYKMMVSQNADFSGASLESFASPYTPSPVLTDDPARIYLRIQDKYGNHTDSVASTPEKPGNIIYFDTSRSQDNLYQEFVAWDAISPLRSGSGAPVYEIYRKDNTQNDFSLLTTISNTEFNYYLDTGLDGAKTYSYKIRNRDSHWDVSQYSAVITDQPNGQGATDTTAPNISGVSITDVGTTSAAVNWTTDEISDSGVGYSTDNTYLPERGIGSMVTNHRIVLTNLAPGTVYYVRVKSRDAAGNLGRVDRDNPGVNNIADFRLETSPGPAISSVTVPNISNNQATIAWKTTTNSSSYVIYSPTVSNGQLDAPKEFGTPDLVGGAGPYGHSITINSYNDQPLLNDTKYYFSVKSVDGTGNVAIDNNGGNYYELLTTADDTPPIISAVDTPVLSQESVAVTWVTDEPATSKVSYGEKNGGPYRDTQEVNVYDRNHFVILSGLTPDTKYYFKVTSRDINGNERIGGQNEFTTQKDLQFQHDPLSSIDKIRIPVETLSDTNAVVTFTTDQQALCLAELTVSSGSYTNPVVAQEDGYDENINYSTAHTLRLVNLISSTPYYFRITCHDNLTDDNGDFANIVTSDEDTFTTREKLYTASGYGELGDHIPPVISNIKTSNITGESAVVTWDTDEKTNSNVRFGVQSSDESMAGDPLTDKGVDSFSTTHTVTVIGLVPATKYRFVVSSTDVAGNITLSSESSFQTASPSSISSINAASNALGEAVISWHTSKSTTSVVEYGATINYGEKKESTTLVQDHSVSLTGLSLGQTYHFRVKGQDANKMLYSSSDNTFQPKSPPKITGVSIDGITDHEATVKFLTDVPADGNITFTDAKNPDHSGYQGKPDLVSSHEIVLHNLSPGSDYKTKIQVRDEQGTQTETDGPDFSTTVDKTPPAIDQVRADSALSQSDKVQTIISWTTDEPATSQVTFWEGRGGQETTINVSDGLTTSHTSVITAFKPGTVYEFRVKSVDVSGNESVSKDYALRTPQQTQNIVQIIVGNFQDIFQWAKL